MLFFLYFRPTINFQGGSFVDPFLERPASPLLTRPLKNYFYRHFGVSDLSEGKAHEVRGPTQGTNPRKVLRVVTLLRVVLLLSHCDLL